MRPETRTAPEWLDVSRETMAKLIALEDLILRWSPKINLISKSTHHSIWTRHILDSAQLVHHAPVDWSSWTDLGSGGGFPGLVITILADDQSKSVNLVESDARKCAFLRAASIELGLATNTITARIEHLDPLNSDIVSARALAPLDKLLPMAKRHLAPDGICLFTKGAKTDEELTTSQRSWKMSVQRIPSLTDPSGTVLKIGDLSSV